MQSTDCCFSFFLFQTHVRKLLLPPATLSYLKQTLGYSSSGQNDCTAAVTHRHWLYFPVTMGLVLRLTGVKGGGCCCPMETSAPHLQTLKTTRMCYLGRTLMSCLQKVSSCLAPRSCPNERQTPHSCPEVF